MSEQDDRQVSTTQRPTSDDPKAWKEYWKAQGLHWRTEPEIDAERQKYLTERRAVTPDIENGIYPFKDIKLSRADVEWLLATHTNGQRRADENDWRQPGPDGLDLRGANLCQVDLSLLPLTRLRAGLKYDEWINANGEQRAMAIVLMEGASLHWAHLEGAYFYEAHLQRADLREAPLQGAHFRGVHLEGALLRGAHLEGASFQNAHLEGSDLRGAFFTSATNLAGIFLSNQQLGSALLGGVRWDDVELSAVDWTPVKILGDEQQARQRRGDNRETKNATRRLHEYQAAVRAYRKLAVALQEQGLNEEGARFAYQGQRLQRVVVRLERKLGQYLFLLFLDLLAGYGYKPWRSFAAYLIVIAAFAIIYFLIGHTVGPVLSPLGAFVFSMTSFHGRGFFPGGIGIDDPLTVVAAFEAFIGLLIEVTFIATLTQRLFGK